MKALLRAATLLSALTLFPTVAFAAASDAAALDALEAKVHAEAAIRAAKRLQNAYAQYLTEGLWVEAAELFTVDATATFEPGAAPITGKAAIRAYLMDRAGRKEQGLAEGQLHTYLDYQPILNLSDTGETVLGTWHEVALLGRFNESAEWNGGIYENAYVLDGGRWKISKLQYFPQYSGTYDAYGHKAPAAWNVPYHFEAAHVGMTIPPAALAALTANASGDEAQRIAAVASQVQQFADETAVQNLQHSFGYYLDRKMYDDMTDLFAANATIEIGQSGVYAGAKHVQRLIETLYGTAAPRTGLANGELFDHINLGTVVTIGPAGNVAASRTSQLSQLGRNGEYARWELGTYENTYLKESGVWKISAMRYFPRMNTDYDLGWAADARPADATRTTTWDKAPAHSFASYPAAQTVGFHYPHPVTGQAVEYPDNAVVQIPVAEDAARAAPASTATVADLEHQLDAAIAVDAVENLMSSYGYYIDESAWDNMAATFASKGSKEITGVGVYVGPERIREILNRRGPRTGRSPTFFTIHQLVQPVIHIADDNTYANARLRLFQGGGNADGSSGSWIGGIYENTAFFENGEWKFGRQDLHHLFNASYRNGWARVGPSAAQTADEYSPKSGPAGRAFRGGGITQGLGGAAAPNQFAADYPPDSEIRAKQYAFPEITVTAFHYNNPVSGREPPELLP
jgi:hypothetical protein